MASYRWVPPLPTTHARGDTSAHAHRVRAQRGAKTGTLESGVLDMEITHQHPSSAHHLPPSLFSPSPFPLPPTPACTTPLHWGLPLHYSRWRDGKELAEGKPGLGRGPNHRHRLVEGQKGDDVYVRQETGCLEHLHTTHMGVCVCDGMGRVSQRGNILDGIAAMQQIVGQPPVPWGCVCVCVVRRQHRARVVCSSPSPVPPHVAAGRTYPTLHALPPPLH